MGTRAASLPAELSSFLHQHPGPWEVRWDVRSDRPHLIQGVGIPLVPGRGNTLRRVDAGLPAGRALAAADLEPLLRGFLERFPELFRTSAASVPTRSPRPLTRAA
jgi:hypothetical protein